MDITEIKEKNDRIVQHIKLSSLSYRFVQIFEAILKNGAVFLYFSEAKEMIIWKMVGLLRGSTAIMNNPTTPSSTEFEHDS